MKQDSCGSVYLTEFLWHAMKKLPEALRSQRIVELYLDVQKPSEHINLNQL